MTHPLPLPTKAAGPSDWLPERLVAEKPDNVSWAEAGAFPVPALTAEQVVSEALGVQPGETILVNGAGGVTGGMSSLPRASAPLSSRPRARAAQNG